MLYLQLFWAFFQIGLFSIGGGYAALPLIQNQVVELHQWLSLTEFTDLITISQMTPGPIAINSATFVGIRIAGPGGAVVATLGCVLPSCIIVLILTYFYFKYRGISTVQGILLGLRPAVVAMIFSAGLSILSLAFFGTKSLPVNLDSVDFISVVLFACSFAVLRRWKPNPIYVMAAAGVSGLLLYSL